MNTKNEKTNSHSEFICGQSPSFGHSELGSESPERPPVGVAFGPGFKDYGFRNKFGMTKSGEHGRSIVEMLGVVAIVGILSIGAVSGYTTAMKKYKANELLNEASKRAAVIAMQIASEQTLSITEFGNNEVAGATFSAPVAGNSTFKMTLSGVDEGVCEQIKNMLGNDASMAIKESCGASDLTLIFNKDLKRGNISLNDEYSSSENENDGENYAMPPYCTDHPENCETIYDDNSKPIGTLINVSSYSAAVAACGSRGFFSSEDLHCTSTYQCPNLPSSLQNKFFYTSDPVPEEWKEEEFGPSSNVQVTTLAVRNGWETEWAQIGYESDETDALCK